jgi:hypothetical protein
MRFKSKVKSDQLYKMLKGLPKNKFSEEVTEITGFLVFGGYRWLLGSS